MTEGGDLARHWALDPAVVFLNHGSFGACPREVRLVQDGLRARMEAEPVRFLSRELEGLLDEARRELGAFVGADPDDLAFVPNATTGVNTVVRSLSFATGDELLTTDHAYNACRNALQYVAGRSGARVVTVGIPFPLDSAARVMEAVLSAVTPRTRLALLDHVSSPTGLVFPVDRLVAELARRGVDTIVDGAHAPGMLPLDLDRLGAAYYTGNGHKWLCAPKGSAFLHVRRDRQHLVRPLTISHGANSPRRDRSPFRLEFDWTGTADPTAYLSLPAAIRCVGAMLPGGWPEIMARNRRVAIEARRALCAALGIAVPGPDEMIGALGAVPLPDGRPDPPGAPARRDGLQDLLFERFGIEVPVMRWPSPPARLIRVSAQLYNTPAQFGRLAGCLSEALAAERQDVALRPA